MRYVNERRTRKEQQAQTRTDLLEAAVRVYGEHGLVGASLEQVATEAGYTKGAVYANFSGRDELLLAVLDKRFAERLAALDDVLAQDLPIEAQARVGGEEFQLHLGGDRRWERLFFEFAAHAARDEGFRIELVARWRALVERIAEALQRRAEAEGHALSVPTRTLGLAVFATANGVALQQLLDPDGVPDGFFATVLELLAIGALARDASTTGAP